VKTFDQILQGYNRSTSFLELQKVLNQVASSLKTKPPDKNLTEQRIAVVSNYSTPFICSALKLSLINRGVWAEIFEDDFDQWEISPLQRDGPLYQFKPDLILFLLSSIPLAFGQNLPPDEITQRICHVVEVASKRSKAKIAITLPEPLSEDRGWSTWAFQWRKQMLGLLETKLPENSVKIDIDPLVRSIGSNAWFSHRFFISSKFTFHPNHTRLFCEHLANVISDLISPRVKLIITDLDDTLWGGVVGEIGASNVDLNYQETGYAYLRLQKFLSFLNSQGVLLAIASKNYLDSVKEVFESRPEMILKESSFSSIKINWEVKSKNIQAILDDLKLSTKGVVFLDDSPFEREEVRQSIPDIIVPELSKDPVGWVDELLAMGIFYRHSSSREDKKRQTLYKDEQVRQEQKVGFKNEKEFLKSLQLRLKVRPFDGSEQRVLDLINKTNQFNFTTRRYSRSMLEGRLKEGSKVFVFELEDKFGSYGIISVLLAVPEKECEYRIDVWLMSCRVINRRVEASVLDLVLTELESLGCKTVIGEYISSPKNKLTELVYQGFGFQKRESRGTSQFFELRLENKDKSKLEHFCHIDK